MFYRTSYKAIFAATAFIALAFPAKAATLYSSEAAFVAAAGPAKASLPVTLASTSSFSAAPFSFSADAGQSFVIDTPIYGQPILGEDNLLFNGYESQTLVSAAPLYAFGFNIFQPSNAAPNPGPNGVACYFPCDTGSFTVTLFLGATMVDNFTFVPATDTVEFHGYAGIAPFDKIRIEDDLSTIDDEYFATYRYATQPVPEPPVWVLSAAGLTSLLLVRSRRRS